MTEIKKLEARKNEVVNKLMQTVATQNMSIASIGQKVKYTGRKTKRGRNSGPCYVLTIAE